MAILGIQEKTVIIGNVGEYQDNVEYGNRPPRHPVVSPRTINTLIQKGWKVTKIWTEKVGFGFGETYQEGRCAKMTLKK